MNRQQLHQDLITHLTPAELTAFSGRLGINYHTLGGKTSSDKAASLLSKMERNGRLPELVYWFIQAKPELEPAYHAYLQAETGPRDAHLGWLDSLAAGEGPSIEEPPTMRWDSEKYPRDDEK